MTSRIFKQIFFLTRPKSNYGKCAFFFWVAVLGLFNNSYYNSQTLDFERYTTKDGLLSDEVYNLHQDKAGYLWVFSKFGTVKFNGTKFKRVLTNLSFKESFIYCIYENKRGQKWVANSNAKIFEIKNDSAFLVVGIEDVTEILKKQVSEIYKLIDDSLNIHVFTKGYSYKLFKNKKGYNAINLSRSFNADSIVFSINDIGRDVFVIANREMIDGLTYINKNDTRSYIKVEKRKKQYINSSVFFRLKVLNTTSPIRSLKKYKGNYCFLFSNSFGILDANDSLSFTILKTSALNFTADRYGHFWVGCLNDGMYELNSKGVVVNHYLNNITVNDVLIDHQDGLWATTAGSGLYHCENMSAICFNDKESFGVPIELIKIIDGALFVANTKGEIFKIDSNETLQVKKQDNLETYDIEVHNGKIRSSNITGSWTLSNGKHYKAEILNGLNPVYRKLISKSQDTLIGCTRQSIIYTVKDEIRKSTFYDRKIMSFEYDKGLLWIATDNGVYTVPVGFTLPSKILHATILHDSIKLNQLNCIEGTFGVNVVKIVKSNNALWFCSQGNGLAYFFNNKIQNYSTMNGLPDNVINDFFLSSEGLALLASNSGVYLSRFDFIGRTFRRWIKIHTGAVQTCALYNNKIYLGAQDGLIIRRDETSTANEKKLFFNLAAVTIDSREVDAASFVGLTSDQRSLELDFDLIDFTKDNIPVLFHLTGPQTDSGYIENTHLRFAQLIPGKYSLSVRPDTGVGMHTHLEISFDVKPAIWQTKIFRISFFTFVLLIFLTTLYLIIRYNRRKEAAKIKNEQLILEYKLIALKAQINPHFMSNCLSAIQDLIMNDQSEKATFYVAQFGLMVRQILDYSSKQIINLKEELDLLTIYMELEQLRFENKFVFKIHYEKDINLKATFVPPLILNPIVENAIWHGLLPMQNRKRGELHIVIVKKDNNLIFSIQDNGVGRKEDKQEPANNKNKSHGIKITEQRLSNINYLYGKTNSKIIHTDLVDEEQLPTGTKVTIYLPINLAPLQNEEY